MQYINKLYLCKLLCSMYPVWIVRKLWIIRIFDDAKNGGG
jgi:hypothetical protein